MATAGILRAVCAVAVTGLVAGLLVGCTPDLPDPDPTPSPSPSPTVADEVEQDPGTRIAVIVPPAGVVAPAEAAALRRAADDLATEPPDGVTGIRVVRAASEAFVRDLANLAVDDGIDVVCVVGTGSAELALELARSRRDGRFCTTDGRIVGGPVNLVSVALDPQALVEAGAVAIGAARAPVGLLLSPQLGDIEALTTTFTSSVAPPRQPSPSPSPTSGAATTDAATSTTTGPTPPSSATSPASPSPSVPGPTSPQPPFVTVAAGTGVAAQASAGEQLATQRPTRALVLATPGGAGATRAAGAGETELVVVSAWAVDREGESPPNLLVELTVDWGELLRRAIAAALTTDASQVQLLGVADEVIGVNPGQVEESVAAAERTADHLRRSAE